MTFLLANWKYFALAGALGLAFYTIRAGGYEAAETKYKAKIVTMVAEAEEARAEAIARAAEVTLLWDTLETNERALALRSKKEIQIFTNTVIQEKATHVADTDIPKLTVSTGFVRIHTNATRGPGVPSAPSGGPGNDAAPSKITESAVLDVDVDNALLFHECDRRLTYWVNREAHFVRAVQ